jgi:hypothetical protein
MKPHRIPPEKRNVGMGAFPVSEKPVSQDLARHAGLFEIYCILILDIILRELSVNRGKQSHFLCTACPDYQSFSAVLAFC